jgi:hypothetical protein
LGGIFEHTQLLFQTYITSKQRQKYVRPSHVDQLRNNEQDTNLGGSP